MLKKKIHYSWIVCIMLMLIMTCTLGLGSTSLSIFLPFMRETLGFTNVQTSTIVNVRLFTGIITTFFIDKYIKLLGVKKGGICSLLFLFICMLGFAFSKSYIAFLFFAIFDGLAYSSGGMVVMSVAIAAWFKTDKSTALGIVSAGSGVASIIAPPIVTRLYENFSLSISFLSVALFIALIIVLALIILKDKPEDIGLMPFDNGKSDADDQNIAEFKAIDEKLYWLLVFSFVLEGVYSFSVTSHLSNIYRSTGMANTSVSYVVSVFGLAMLVFKFVYGHFVDRLGAYKSLFIFGSFFTAGGIMMCLGNRGLLVAFIAVFLAGMGIPVSTVGITASVRSICGPQELGRRVKYCQIALMLGGLVGTFIPGYTADKLGSYIPGFAVGVVCFVLFVLLFIFINKKAKA